jgi:hypothetical protein
MRVVAHAGGVVADDALRGGEYFGAAATFAQAAVWGVCSGEAAEGSGGDFAERGAWAGLGIPVDARDEERCLESDSRGLGGTSSGGLLSVGENRVRIASARVHLQNPHTEVRRGRHPTEKTDDQQMRFGVM